MNLKTWIFQLLGIVALLLLFVLIIPSYTQTIPSYLLKETHKRLQEQKLDWVSIRGGSDRDLILSGIAPSIEEHHLAMKIANSINGVRNIQDKISPKIIQPYTMNINWDGKNLILEGFLFDKNSLQEIEQFIKNHFNNAVIKNKIDIAKGHVKNWHTLIISILEHTKNLDIASVDIVENSISISGKAKLSQTKESFKKEIREFEKDGYKISIHIIAMDKTNKICQKKYNTILNEETIIFESSQATIHETSYALLENLLQVSALCPKANFEIIGHTDNIGDTQTNQKLSQQRADAVKNWFFQNGISLERLESIGVGETFPISSNDTQEGRAQNRRIEFIVKGY